MMSMKPHNPFNPLPAQLILEESYILGYNVERLRVQSHMDISTFAQVAGIARPTVYKVERGESNLKLSYLKKIADALDVSIVELLTPPFEYIDSAYYRSECQIHATEIRERAFHEEFF